MVRGRRNPLHVGLGDRLRRSRRVSGLSGRALAELAAISHPVIRHLEQEGRVPRVDIAERLARALGVPAGWLAYGVELPFAPQEALGSSDLAARLAALRTAQGLTLKALAEAAGITSTTVMYIEGARVMPTLDTAERLAWSLGVTPAWLAFGEGAAAADRALQYSPAVAETAEAAEPTNPYGPATSIATDGSGGDRTTRERIR